MFLYDCIGLSISNISNITNKIIELFYNCNYFINKSQIVKCLDKEYMYNKYCNISIKTCNCIQNSIDYINSNNYLVYDINYYFFIFYVSMFLVVIYFCCKKPTLSTNNMTNNMTSNSNIILLDEDDTTSNLLDNETIVNNNYYVIDKYDTLPKYNEIDNVTNPSHTTHSHRPTSHTKPPQITIIEISPPKYNEIE